MNDLASLLRAVLPLIVLAALIGVVGAWDASFLAPANLLSVASDTMTLFLMASGLTIVIIIGGIDLSVQAVASMTSCIVAALMPKWGAATIALALAAGALAGWIGGVASIRLRIPSFIATLAVSGVVTSVAYWVSATRAINIPEALSKSYLFWAVGTTFGLPREIAVGLVALAVLTIALDLTAFGRRVRAVGAQERAALAAGLDVDRVKIAAFTLSGLMAGLAGIVMSARLGSGSPVLANEFLLPAVACIIVGGTSITGGVGSIWRTFVGALILQGVRIGMTYMGVTVFAQQIVFGFILVAAVAVTMDRRKAPIVK